MTKKLSNDEKAMRAIKRALELTEKCHTKNNSMKIDCAHCLFKCNGCKAARIRHAIEYILVGDNKIYKRDGTRV